MTDIEYNQSGDGVKTPTSDDLMERLRELDANATSGPWAYRPDHMDDWGIVKSPRQPVEGFEGGLRCCLAQFRHPEALDDEVLSAHRRAKTDPWRGNAELVVHLRNSVPAILSQAEESAALRARCEALEGALGEARLQLEYLDERSPSGTTPPIIGRIDAALSHRTPSPEAK